MHTHPSITFHSTLVIQLTYLNLSFACHFQARRLDMLFVLGGNGTHAGANAIHEEVHSLRSQILIRNNLPEIM
jgi:6-phosphofructokinase